jgi:hypothetical protein
MLFLIRGASSLKDPSRISPTQRCPYYSEISSNLGTVLPIGLTKLLLEVALLAQNNPAQPAAGYFA